MAAAIALLMVFASLLAGPATAAELVENGSFETPTILQGATWPIAIPGWTSSDPSGFELHRHFIDDNAADGDQWIELDFYFNTFASQDIATVPGGSYVLRYSVADRPGDSRTSGIRIHWGDQVVATVSLPESAWLEWTTQSHVVTATSDTTQIAFEAIGASDGYGDWLDAVSVSGQAGVAIPQHSCISDSIPLTPLGVGSAIDIDVVGSELLVADAANEKYWRIDPNTKSVLGSVPVPFRINDHGSDFNPATGHLLHVIDDDDGSVTSDSFAETSPSETNPNGAYLVGPVSLTSASEDPEGLAVDPASGRVWITTGLSQTGPRVIREIDTQTGASISDLSTNEPALALEYHIGADRLLFGSAHSAVFEMKPDGSGERLLVQLPSEVGEIVGMSISPNGDLWVISSAGALNAALKLTCVEALLSADPVPTFPSPLAGAIAFAVAIAALVCSRRLSSRESVGPEARL